jgi:hypothetical protein
MVRRALVTADGRGVVKQVPTTITPYPDGPLLVRGDVELRGPDGEPIERTRRTVALCRCGLSRIKPFCDGTHKAADFRTGD